MKGKRLLTLILMLAMIILWLCASYVLLVQISISDFELDFSLGSRLRDAIGIPREPEASQMGRMLYSLLGSTLFGCGVIALQWVLTQRRETFKPSLWKKVCWLQALYAALVVVLLVEIGVYLEREGSSGMLAFGMSALSALALAGCAVRLWRERK